MDNIPQSKILVVDDDEVLNSVLVRAFQRRNFEVFSAFNAEQALAIVEQSEIDKVVLDLKLAEDSGLQLLPQLLKINAAMQIVILTGYSSIATAVEAIKLGATNYLCKPADADEILAAFNDEHSAESISEKEQLDYFPPSVDRLEWEHIQKVLNENEGNISATARALGMHRRTLQRKLNKRPVKR